LIARFDNLHHLMVRSYEAIELFEIGLDPDITGDALGERVRECNLDLPALGFTNMRRVTINFQFKNWISRNLWTIATEGDIPKWRTFLEQGAQKVAEWIGEEYKALGLRVVVDVQTDPDKLL
jgi:hypothetical protein